MVRIEKLENSIKSRVIIEIETYEPGEMLANLKNSIIETLCDSMKETESASHALPLVRFLQELMLQQNEIEKGLLKD